MERFTLEERIILASLPSIAGGAMVLAEDSGLGTIKEIVVKTRSILHGAERYPKNPIIQAILPLYHKTGQPAETDKNLQKGMDDYLRGHRSKDEIKQRALDTARKANAVLFIKATPLEAEQYKAWILYVAEEVSKAAKEGGLMGLGGVTVSPGEKEFFMELAAALSPLKSKA